jgi:predicted RND superfamily exporter protein
MSRYTGNMTQQESNENNSNLHAVVQILQARLQSLEEKIKSQEEEIKSQNEIIKRLRNKNHKKITNKQEETNNERPMLFGTIDGDFSEDKLIQLREDNDIDGIKKYITAYYAKVPDTKFVVKYCKSENKYDYIDSNVFKNNTLKPLEIKFIDDQGRKSKYNFIEWFYSLENPGYKLITDPNKPRVFEQDGVRYLNLIYDQLHIHKEKKPLDSYPEKIKLRVQHIWKHIKEAWCSEK